MVRVVAMAKGAGPTGTSNLRPPPWRAMNKQSGNMYPFVTHTWNPVRGCLHDCVYCYVKALRGYDTTPRLSEKALHENLGNGNYIFVGSTSDMFGSWVPDAWILAVLDKCRGHENTYLFQTKNPVRLQTFCPLFPVKSVLAATIETNREFPTCGVTAPPRFERMNAMRDLRGKKMVSIEPVIDFDTEEFLVWLHAIDPELVSVGADSKHHGLPEPTPDKISDLIGGVERFATVIRKGNLDRLCSKPTSIRASKY